MRITRRTIGFALLGAGVCVLAGPAVSRLFAQEQPPNRREFTITAKNYEFSPRQIEVMQDDLVKITLRSEDWNVGSSLPK